MEERALSKLKSTRVFTLQRKKLDQRTHEHRHRLRVKIPNYSSGAVAEHVLEQHLQKALNAAQSIPENTSLEKMQVWLRLLTDLQQQLKIYTA